MMILRKAIFMLFFTVVLAGSMEAQKSRRFDWDRVVYGGSVFPLISNFGTYISANPFVGYKVTDRLVPGVMLSYQYISYNNSIRERFNLFGVSPFVRYAIYNGLFAQAEYEFLNGTYEAKAVSYKSSFSENNLFLGGGYINTIAGNSGLYAQIMYNVTWTRNSVYPSPLIYRIGFTLF